MPIPLSNLRTASYSYSNRGQASFSEARASGRRTAFLSHSHLDSELGKGLQVTLTNLGWDVFIDWQHTTLDQGRPTRELAQFLQYAMDRADWLIYLATSNSERSRWCPWEIGYANGKKGEKSILIAAGEEGSTTYGSEYLLLYRSIGFDAMGGFNLYEAGGSVPSRPLKSVNTNPSFT